MLFIQNYNQTSRTISQTVNMLLNETLTGVSSTYSFQYSSDLSFLLVGTYDLIYYL